MAEIKAKQVMELRKKSGAGIMDAKKALVASDGDMDKAMDWLREKGIAKAAKKSDRIAAEGLTNIAVDGNTAVIVELNSETDFVAASDPFKESLADVTKVLLENKPADLDAALASKTANGTLNDDLISTTQKTGEKVSLRRFAFVNKEDGDNFGVYLHQGGRIAALVVLQGADEETAKDVAMHVAAVNPEFMTREEVPADRLAHEREVFKEETADGSEAVYLSISSGVSGSMQSAMLAAQEFDGKVKVFDSHHFCISLRVLVEYAKRLADEGKNADEIVESLNEALKKVRIIAVFATLENLRKGGRLSSASAFVGELLAIKPMITIKDGGVEVLGKARGMKKGIKAMRDYIESEEIDLSMPYAFAYSGSDRENIETFIAENGDLYDDKTDVEVSYVGATVGTYAGPGAIATAYFVN